METRICTKCGKEKPLTEFNRASNKSGRTYRCTECLREYSQQHYRANSESYKKRILADKRKKKEFINEVKASSKCSICGESRPWCLEFHHLDGEDKDFNIGDTYRNYGIDRLKNEMSKCIIVCANCHKDIHYKERNGLVV